MSFDRDRTRSRARDAVRLLEALQRVDAYVAAAEIDDDAERWRMFFAEEIDTVQRARNNVVWCEWISDRNLHAGAQMAEKLAGLAEETKTADA